MAQGVQLRKTILRRIWPRVLPALPPVLLLGLYYILRNSKPAMDWVLAHISLPYRAAAARVTSFGPFRYFSLVEILLTVLILWALYWIGKTAVLLIRGPRRLFHLGRRLYSLILVALYILTCNAWLWDAGYYAAGLGEKTELRSEGITIQQLTEATRLFAEGANALSSRVERDENGRFSEDRQSYFRADEGLYASIVREFPALDGETHPPKPMLYSKIMSACGFTGVYIALTGETNINADAPAPFMPATIAHEMAHQRGVNSEEEANFAAIAACITSGNPVFEYSGYLLGLTYLANTLNRADPYICRQITATLNAKVLQDWRDNNAYWDSHETPATEMVTAMYDDYLKSNGITSGVQSYGACVDMLASWLVKG